MSARELSTAAVPDPTAPHLSLWNTAAFYALNPEAVDRRIQLDHHDESGRLVGSLVGARVGDTLVSGFGAPMGGVDFVRRDEVPRQVVELVRAVFEQAAASGVARVEVRMKPGHHGPAEAHLAFVLLEAGARVELTNLSFFVDVALPTEEILSSRAAKAARRAEDAGARVDALAHDDEKGWAAAYAVLERNRVEKGRPMRLSLAYVRRLRDAFGPLVRMHLLRDAGGRPSAAALLYRTAERHDVVQYWGDVAADLPVSPMPLLARQVFGAAAATGARHVDLGISTDDGRPNHGLIQFKRSVGALTELRLVVVADVSAVLASPRWERLRG